MVWQKVNNRRKQMGKGNYVQENLESHHLHMKACKAMRNKQKFVCWSCGSEKHANDGVTSKPAGFGTGLTKFVCFGCKEAARVKKLTKEKVNEATDTTQEN
jgi:hypothetical protein